MTNQQILQKAVQKAIDGGWKPWIVPLDKDMPTPQWAVRIMEMANWAEIIFNHEFAKALWGEELHENLPPQDPYGEERCPNCGHNDSIAAFCWQYHLQQLVVADDIFKYLEEHAL